MKTIIRNQSSKIVSIKLIAFLSWFIYIVIAIFNNILIEAFLFSIAFVAISYHIFGGKNNAKHKLSAKAKHKDTQHTDAGNNNYLSVFFYSAS